MTSVHASRYFDLADTIAHQEAQGAVNLQAAGLDTFPRDDLHVLATCAGNRLEPSAQRIAVFLRHCGQAIQQRQDAESRTNRLHRRVLFAGILGVIAGVAAVVVLVWRTGLPGDQRPASPLVWTAVTGMMLAVGWWVALLRQLISVSNVSVTKRSSSCKVS